MSNTEEQNQDQELQIDEPVTRPKKYSRKEMLLKSSLMGLGVIAGSGFLASMGMTEDTKTRRRGIPTPTGPHGGPVNPNTEVRPALALVPPEKTLEKLLDLKQKIELISKIRLERDCAPESIAPSPLFREMFAQLDTDISRLKEISKQVGEKLLNDAILSDNIYNYWNIAPGKDKPVPQPEIGLNPGTEDGDMMYREISALPNLIPNLGRILRSVSLEPRENRGDWPYDAGTYTYRNSAADVFIRDNPKTNREDPNTPKWSRKLLLQTMMHELYHAVSLRGEGNIFQYISHSDAIDWLLEDTQLKYKQYHHIWSKDTLDDAREEERDAPLVAGLLAFKDLPADEVVQAKLKLFNSLFSKILGINFDIITLGKQLNLTN